MFGLYDSNMPDALTSVFNTEYSCELLTKLTLYVALEIDFKDLLKYQVVPVKSVIVLI